MRHGSRTLLIVALAGLACTAAASDDTDGPTAEQVLAAMDRTPTWGHPDQAHEFAGMHAYQAGDYRQAMAEFKQAARYADKLSQLSIGLMYLNGQGVQKDPVAAFAWVAIAAERRYPQFLATRDGIWATLDTAQREQARTLVERLYPEYGDATAKERMAKVLRRYRTRQTGSFLGFDSDRVLSMAPGTGRLPPCGAPTIGGVSIVGCGNIYAASRWDPKLYFESRGAVWKGTVTVGPLQQADNVQPRARPPAAGDR